MGNGRRSPATQRRYGAMRMVRSRPMGGVATSSVEHAQSGLDAARQAEADARAAWRSAPQGSAEKSAAALRIWSAQREVLEAEGRLHEARGGTGYAVRYESDAARAALAGLLGPAAAAKIGPMTGAGYADRVTVLLHADGVLTLDRQGRAIQAGTGRADLSLWRVGAGEAARRGVPAGTLVAEVGLVRSEGKTAASGREVLASMRAVRDAGVSRVYATAEGDPSNPYMNGYSTWARAGAEGDIPADVLPAARARFGPGVTRVEQIIDAPGGPAWWRANGHWFEATFDLTPGGRAARFLDRLAARGE